MKITPYSFLLLVSAMIGVNCRSKAPNTIDSQVPRPQGQETEVVVFCSGPEFFTTSEVFRANSVGESIDQTVAKRKAMSNARSELAASIRSTVKSVTDSYVNARENNNTEDLQEHFEGFSREVVSQELRGLRVICEKFTFTEEGKYKAYVAIELSAQHLVEAYYQRLAKTKTLEVDEDYEKFKRTFAEQMVKGN